MGIKMTCFPNALSKTSTHPSPTTKTMDSSEHMALPLSQCSKIVIEIHQPRNAQAYTSGMSLPSTTAAGTIAKKESGGGEGLLPVELRKTSAAAAHLARSSSSIIGHRRSASRDLVSYGACKKRRADSVDDAHSSGLGRSEKGTLEEEDEDAELQQENEEVDGEEADEKATNTVAEAAAAAVVAAAAAQATNKRSVDVDIEEEEERSKTETSGNSVGPDAIQVFGIDYLAQADQKPSSSSSGLLGLGLGLPSSSSSSVDKTVDALQVARASSYVVLEDQKEMGVDYSLFTRVETAGWRILIPPNVIASFRSEDFGLMLKPKGLADVDMHAQQDVPVQEQQQQQEPQGQKVVSLREKELRKEVLREENDDEEEVEEEEEEEVLTYENNEDDDVGTEGVRRIALRDDDSRAEENVAAKSVSYYHRHTHQQHHVAQDLEMQDDEEVVTVAVKTVTATNTVSASSAQEDEEQSQGQGHGVTVKETQQQEGDIEMDRE
jgi:hypothetical protein